MAVPKTFALMKLLCRWIFVRYFFFRYVERPGNIIWIKNVSTGLQYNLYFSRTRYGSNLASLLARFRVLKLDKFSSGEINGSQSGFNFVWFGFSIVFKHQDHGFQFLVFKFDVIHSIPLKFNLAFYAI